MQINQSEQEKLGKGMTDNNRKIFGKILNMAEILSLNFQD